MPLSAKEAIKKFSVDLLKELPLDDPIFFRNADAANLFPLDNANSIRAKDTNAKKVDYFLQHVLEPGADHYLPILLKVMKNSATANVVGLADKIQAAMEPDTAISAPPKNSAATVTTSSVNMPSSFSQVKLFISYAWEQATDDFVLKLKKDLEDKGLNVFLDKHDIVVGEDILHAVANGMEDSNGIIVVYSERYPDSKWCDSELQMAKRCNKPIFPLRRIKSAFKGTVNLVIGSLLYADFTEDDDDEYQRSLDSLIKVAIVV